MYSSNSELVVYDGASMLSIVTAVVAIVLKSAANVFSYILHSWPFTQCRHNIPLHKTEDCMQNLTVLLKTACRVLRNELHSYLG